MNREQKSDVNMCLEAARKQESDFNASINKNPELAKEVLGVFAKVGRDGNFERLEDGRLWGYGHRYDPDLQNASKKHFDKQRLKCHIPRN